MKKMAARGSNPQATNALVTVLLIALTFALIIAVYFRIFFPNFSVGPFRVLHWFGWIGALYISASIPIFHFLKLRKPKRYMTLLRFHMFGNLLSVAFISGHFAQQLTRSPAAYPDLTTGLVLIIVLFVLVSTGMIMRFGGGLAKMKAIRFIHMGVTISFYLDLFVHILHGLGFI